jgi:hypothetical protein
MASDERIAIIGAGPSGLTALCELTNAGLDAVAFDRSARVGGIWSLGDHSTAAYPALHLITSRARTEFARFPMPADTPDYPSRAHVGRYLEAYVEHFGLQDRLRLGTEVVAARQDAGGKWVLELGDGSSETYDAVVVASGHNEIPKWPEPAYPGEFAGRQLHALDYDGAEAFAGRRVLVVGMGNSAMDIATELSYAAQRTLLSVRHGSWIIPKRLLGKPADQVVKPWVAVHVPWQIRQPVSQLLLRATVGPPERIGFPPPQRGLFQDHPTITDTVPSRIAHGAITPVGPIDSFDGDHVRFADGRREQVDAVVWCTGYRVALPFLDQSLVGPDPKELPLYKRIFHLEAERLYFIGLMQSTGSALPIVERQSELLAAHLAGRWALPAGKDAMRKECAARRRRSRRRWGEHGRPAMRVDFDGYMHELAREIAAGARRARAAGAAA